MFKNKNKNITVEVEVLNSNDIVAEINNAKSVNDAKKSLSKLQIKVTPKKFSDTKDWK